MRKIFTHTYEHIISLENLLEAWKGFVKGKRLRRDVQEFERYLMSNIISLHEDLTAKRYRHSAYEAFNISDPKPRHIHKASVRDRLLHHTLYRALYPFFERTFMSDSYSCRLGKGTHRAINRFRAFGYKASRNHTKTVWVLKGDVRKFFASINQDVFLKIIGSYIPDADMIWLISQVVGSFSSTIKGVGLPLGNLTSQLFVNVYMNEFDQFMKHKIKARYYIRYADDFVVLSQDKEWLEATIPHIRDFLQEKLRLELHPDKVSIETIASGVDFLGYVLFPHHRVLRTATKRRMLKRISERPTCESVNSYLGLLRHGNSFTLQEEVRKTYLRASGNGSEAIF